MTVATLIKYLQEFPPQRLVTFTWNDDLIDIDYVDWSLDDERVVLS